MDLLPDILVTNEPSRVSCGGPDYVLTRKEVPVGYIEAKNIVVNLHSKQLKEQFDRNKSGTTNLYHNGLPALPGLQGRGNYCRGAYWRALRR